MGLSRTSRELSGTSMSMGLRIKHTYLTSLKYKSMIRLKYKAIINLKYKAIIITKAFRQEYRVNFDEVLSPIVKMTTLRFLLGVVATEDLELLQLDVKTIFLHDDLQEEIYMQQLQGFTSPGQ